MTALTRETASPHPVDTFMQEHEIIRYCLGDLDVFMARLKASHGLDSLGDDLAGLKAVAQQLLEAESHHQREEEALFPKMEEYGIVEAPTMMTLDHVEFRKRKQALYQLAHHPRDHEFPEFKIRVINWANISAGSSKVISLPKKRSSIKAPWKR